MQPTRDNHPTGTVQAGQLARIEIIVDHAPGVEPQGACKFAADFPIRVILDHDDDLIDQIRIGKSRRDLGEDRYMGIS